MTGALPDAPVPPPGLAADVVGAQAVGPACVILNPRSFRLSRGDLAARMRQVIARCGAELVEADGPGDFAAALERFLDRKPRLIAVLGGDGTLQAVVTHVAARQARAPEPVPPLLVLGGGRSNLTAKDFYAGRADLLQQLERVLKAAPHRLVTTPRPTLRVRQGPFIEQHGFFLAGALVDTVIRECHNQQQSGTGYHRVGPLGTPWRLCKLAVGALLGRVTVPAPHTSLDAGELGHISGPLRLLVATTLQNPHERLNPYAARGAGPLRMTATLSGAKGFWRHLPSILRGRFADGLNERTGYLSGHAEQLTLRGLSGFTLDGQEFDIDPGEPLLIDTGPVIDFVRP